jgi:hypothetical protein
VGLAQTRFHAYVFGAEPSFLTASWRGLFHGLAIARICELNICCGTESRRAGLLQVFRRSEGLDGPNGACANADRPRPGGCWRHWCRSCCSLTVVASPVDLVAAGTTVGGDLLVAASVIGC